MKLFRLICILWPLLLGIAHAAQIKDSTLCNGEPVPVIPDGTLACAPDVGVAPDSGQDVAAKINSALTQNPYGIYFPAGEYVINENIDLHGSNNIIGSRDGITVFRSVNNSSPTVGQGYYYAGVNDMAIKNIIMDNVVIYFYGEQGNIEISNNGLINTVSAGSQLAVSHNKFVVSGNVLMRDETHPGEGLSTYCNNGATVQNNLVGEMSDDRLLPVMNYIKPDVYLLINKIKTLAKNGKLTLNDDQGNFQDAWYATSCLTNSSFVGNVIIGNTRECLFENPDGTCEKARDHVTYIKEYNGVDVVNNYYSGWPYDSSGQIKFRNASYLYFAGNYLDKGVDFDARPYDNSSVMKMDHTFVFNNFIADGIVSYWQNFADTDETYIDANNFLVFSNLFDGADRSATYVNSTPYSTHGEFLASENNFPDGTPVNTYDFTAVDLTTAQARLPADKQYLLKVKPIPLWKNIGNISGPALTYNQLVRLDLTWTDSGEKDFIVYDPAGNTGMFPAWDWPYALTDLINTNVGHVCAGILGQTLATSGHCPYMTSVASSYLNNLYTINGKSAEPKISIIDKYNDIGPIQGGDLAQNQSVIFTIKFEDGTSHSVTYTPSSSDWLPAYRWKNGLSTEINNTIDGVCAGQLNVQDRAATSKCEFVQPVGSSYLNDIVMLNGQSATFTTEFITTPSK
ncbi:glycosyl hydrolase family 28-related protein [Paraburkholderia xenovorans]|uniref:glycosyl hydrolase family 28-related protein n=1 Tax=Paraburkholderia xenovorans TaxID=36873 RepID=UPI0038BD5B71